MKRSAAVLASALTLFLILPALAAAEKVKFEPVRAPSKGPDGAKVTVYEIADFM